MRLVGQVGGDADVDIRQRFAQRRQQRQEPATGDGGWHPQADAAGRRAQYLAGRAEPDERFLHDGNEHLTLGGELQASGLAHKEGDAEGGFQPLHLAADGALGQSKRAGGAAEGATARSDDTHFHGAQVRHAHSHRLAELIHDWK